MKRLFSALFASAIAAALLTVPAVAGSTMHSSMTNMHMKHSCPAGKKWVKGYTTKSGKKVHGYCR